MTSSLRPPASKHFSLAVLAATFLGCGSAEDGSKPSVTVLAASSTADAMTEVAARFRDKTGIDVRVSSGPSNGLARQIGSGVPADVFLSASTEWADAVDDFAAESLPLLSNRLVLVVPKGNPANLTAPPELLSPSVTHVALAGETVPASRYAEAALENLCVLAPLLESGKVVRGHDVRATLGFVASGEAEAGIVYATDATTSDDVEVVYEFRPDTHEPIIYPVALLKGGPAGKAGRRFFDFLSSPDAMHIFLRHGFIADEPAGATP